MISFDSKAREKLIELFPNDKVLQSVYEPLNMKMAIQQIDKLLVYADGDVLYPNYNLLAAATGRFRVAQPELQNLVANKNYNVRNLLLEADNVFAIDFSSQEPRMAILLAKETSSAQDFIENKNFHTEQAKSLNITRPQAKGIGLGLFYGMGHELLATTLDISNSEAMRIKDTFKQKYARTFEYIKELDYVEEVKTPLLSRRILFSEGMGKYHTFNWLIQGSCVDLLLVALEHVLSSNKVELRAHIHDSLYLACLCNGLHPNCKQAQEVVQELENLYPFFWPNSEVRAFKFGDIEWSINI